MNTLKPQMEAIMNEPSRARAVFSTEDFELLQLAILTHIKSNAPSQETSKLAYLYHRLGRVQPKI
jgi:hypothetical protein